MMTLTKSALIVGLLILGASAVVALNRQTPTSVQWRLDGSIHNNDTGLKIGIETDLAGNLFGVARVEQARGTPTSITSAQLIADGTVYAAVQQPDGSWRAAGPPARGVRNLRVEAVESGGKVRYYEAGGIK